MMITLSLDDLLTIILCVIMATASAVWAILHGGRRIAKKSRGRQQLVLAPNRGLKRARGDDADAQAGGEETFRPKRKCLCWRSVRV
jgi:hypothetical protein